MSKKTEKSGADVEQKVRKARTPSVKIDTEKLNIVSQKLSEIIDTVKTFEDEKFIDSIMKNVAMAQKKVRAKLNSSKRGEILKALREGKEITIS